MERTFAIIKPNAVEKGYTGKMLTLIEDADFKMVGMRMDHLTQAQAEAFYQEHRERPFFPSLVRFMTSGRVVLLALECEGAVEKFRRFMGSTNPTQAAPGTLRKLFGESLEANSIHGSDSLTSAERELAFFFQNLT